MNRKKVMKPGIVVFTFFALSAPNTGFSQDESINAMVVDQFSVLDVNDDGSLDDEELLNFSNNYTVSTDELLEQYDTSNSSKLEFGEFSSAFEAVTGRATAGGSAPFAPDNTLESRPYILLSPDSSRLQDEADASETESGNDTTVNRPGGDGN